MAYYTPSLTNKTGYTPVVQWPKHSTMHKKNPSGPQITADLFQREMASGSHIQCIEVLSRGSCTQCDRGIANEKWSNSNIKQKKKLMTESVNQNKWSTRLYSPKTTPKALDKCAWHIDDKWRTEAHYAPWPRERDHINNVMRWREKELMTKHQQSQCNIHHETINAMR
jgi:hypothetical protein